MGRDTSASLSLEDSRSWACQAEEPVGVRGLYGQSVFYNGNGHFKAKKEVSVDAVTPRLIHSQRFKVFSQSQSAAVLGSSGSKCSSLPLYIYTKFFFSCYHHQILVLTWCFLGFSFLFSSMYEFSIICLLNAITCNFPGWKKRSSFEKNVMEHPQVEMGPEHSWWLGDFNLLNVSGLMAIQHDWWLPASCYCCGWKGCLPLEDRKLSWATQRAISCDPLIIFFFPTDSPIAEEHKPLEEKLLSVHMLVYISVTRGQSRKMGFAKEHFISGVFFAAKSSLIWPVEDFSFSRDFSHICHPSLTQRWNISLCF